MLPLRQLAKDYERESLTVRLKWIEAILSENAIAAQLSQGTFGSMPKHYRAQNYLSLGAPVESVRFVGPAHKKSLNKLGLKTVGDLLFHFPHRYLNPAEFLPIAQVRTGQEVIVSGRVRQVKKARIATRKMTVVNVGVYDGSGYIWGTWFNQDYMADVLKEGTEVCLRGKVLLHPKFGLQMRTPLFDILRQVGEDADTVHTGRIVPVHPAGSRVTPNFMRRIIKGALRKSGALPDPIPWSVRRHRELLGLPEALQEVHFPRGEEQLRRARERLRFQELFLLQTGLAIRKRRLEEEEPGLTQPVSGTLLGSFFSKLPFVLTQEQEQAVAVIKEDLARPHPMNRLLQGEVGSGKTVIAIVAMLVAVENGNQGAIMAPTEVLAEQHFRKVKEFLRGLGVRVALLTGSLPAKERANILADVVERKVDILIGTHSLIQDEVEFPSLGVVVIDEQHRFGVRQRTSLKKKGRFPDLLIMTATPIPRTLSLTLYGDLDVSVMRERPLGKRAATTRTFLCNRSHRDRAYQTIEAEVAKGRQAYIVCPLIEESDKLEAKAVLEEAERLKNKVFPDLKVGIIHGKLKSTEKERVMTAFRQRELDILISTTVIEVGIDVARATVMLVENADRFGLAQLHQLRGRIGRGGDNAHFILFADPVTEEAKARLKAICEISDGFALAEADLAIRGEGQLFGVRQAGLPDLKLARLPEDMDSLLEARQAAFGLVAKDHRLKAPENALLLREIKRVFAGSLDWLFQS